MPTSDDRRAEWLDTMAARSIEADHSPYRVADFLGWQRDGSLELRPHYQRGSVWTKRDKSFLIDSLLKGFPLPLLVFQDEMHSEHPRVRRRVVDGQQRLRTLFAFIEPEVLSDYSDRDDFTYMPPGFERPPLELNFSDLPSELQNRILNARLPTVLLNASASDSDVLEVYDRLNSTGLDLNAQELRYARRSGAFADTTYRLARENQTRWVAWKLFKDQDVARMKEVEFTSELVLLLMNGVEKTGRKEIDEAYRDPELQIGLPNQENIEGFFLAFMDVLDDYLDLPQRPDHFKMFRTKGWFYALLALTMRELGLLDEEYKRRRQVTPTWDEPTVRRRLEVVLQQGPEALAEARGNNPDLIRSISGAASDRTSRVQRLLFLDAFE